MTPEDRKELIRQHEALRETLMSAHGISKWKKYTEPEAAAFCKRSTSWLKKDRRKGKIVALKEGRNIFYFGVMIADFLRYGKELPNWLATHNVSTLSVSGGSAKEAKPTTDSDTPPPPAA